MIARALISPVLLLIALVAAPAMADWIPTGVPLCQGCAGDIPLVASDGQGGAFIAWRDLRGNEDVFLQRVSALGAIAPGWPSNGLPVSALPSAAIPTSIVSDGSGGALVAWLDYRSGENVYLQRILADGSLAPGWPVNGVAVSLAPDFQDRTRMIPDGASGAFLVWEDARSWSTNDIDIYAQHITAAGTTAPGWPADGAPVCVYPSFQGEPSLAPDGLGGIFVGWGDVRTGAAAAFAQHLLADGSVAPGWTLNGVLQVSGRNLSEVAADDAGGAYLFSATLDPIYPGFDDFYLQRLTSEGATVPGWPAGGLHVCSGPPYRAPTAILSDGFGGVLMSWYDYRPPYYNGAIFALRVQPNATLAAGWNANGTLVSDPNTPDGPFGGSMATDGSGGAYVLWEQDTFSGDHPAYIQHLTAGGKVAPGWLPYGVRVAPSGAQNNETLGSDGQGGVIVAWDEACCGRDGVWAQRFAQDGPVPVELSLVSAEVKDGHVDLDWYSGGTPITTANVSRRTESLAWVALGSIAADGSGHLRYQDRDVTPGARYAYRLGYTEQGVESYTPETWVEIPAPRLALEGLRPNPAVGALTVSFALPSAEAASLEILDVSGRRIAQREVGSMGAGPHVLRLGETGALSPGIYWLRLQQSGRALLARGAVVR